MLHRALIVGAWWCGVSLIFGAAWAAVGLERHNREAARDRYLDTEVESFRRQLEDYDRDHAP